MFAQGLSPPRGPASSSKRRNPFESEYQTRQPKIIHYDHVTLTERTLQKLMESPMRLDTAEINAAAEIAGGACHVCLAAKQAVKCSFCERVSCEMCARQCESCNDVFCSLCITTNYDMRQDRVFCLECNQIENDRMRQATISGVHVHSPHTHMVTSTSGFGASSSSQWFGQRGRA